MPNGKAMPAGDLPERAAGRLALPQRSRSALVASGRPPRRTALRSAEPLVSHSAPSAAKASAVMQPIAGGQRAVARRRSAARRIPGPTAMSPAGEAASAVTGGAESLGRARVRPPAAIENRRSPLLASSLPPAETRLSGAASDARSGASSRRMLGRKAPSIGGMVTALAAEQVEDRIEDHGLAPQ